MSQGVLHQFLRSFLFAAMPFPAILKAMSILKTSLIFGLVAVSGLVGCVEESSTSKKETTQPAVPVSAAKKVNVGKNVDLEVQGDKRRVLVQAYVCLRQGQLEQFLTRKLTKEHEAILAADLDARLIHTALVLAGAEAGKPVQFRPKYQPASGTVITIHLRYEHKCKKIDVPARQWIRHVQT